VKLGFITAPFGHWSLEQVARFAKENGYDALEVCCWPASSGDARRYAPLRRRAKMDVQALFG